MKKYLKQSIFAICASLFVILPCSSISAADGVTEINEANFPNVKLYNLANNMDSNKDGFLSQEEAGVLKNLDISWDSQQTNKVSLKGIEVFTGLERLSVFNASFSTEDVEKLPKSLTELWLDNCSVLSFSRLEFSQLKTLYISDSSVPAVDLSGAPLLETIRLKNTETERIAWGEKKRLKYVDIIAPVKSFSAAGMTNLKTLSLCELPITSIRLSDCKALEKLCITKTQLKKLNLSSHKKLTYVDLRENKLEAFTMKKCSKVEKIFVSRNRLKKLDIRDAKKLTRLEAAWNLLTTFSVDKYPKLKKLDLSCNRLKVLKMKKKNKLERLYLYRNRLTKKIPRKKMPKLKNLIVDNKIK